MERTRTDRETDRHRKGTMETEEPRGQSRERGQRDTEELERHRETER